MYWCRSIKLVGFILLVVDRNSLLTECFSTVYKTSRGRGGCFANNKLFAQIFVNDDSIHRQSVDTDADESMKVHIYENAFSSTACELLHELAVDHNQRTNDGSSIFTRPPFNTRPLTPIEHAIDSALTEMDDDSQTVEYWSRDEYMNIDVHADIDETMLEDGGPVRCPQMGHVLYLQVKEGIKGPTCVFPKEQIGWGVNDDIENSDSYNDKELVVVPCVEGRILRFPGNAMHSVPSPPHRWLLSQKEQRLLKEQENTCEDFEESDDWMDDEDGDWYDDEDDDSEVERSVLLFNTWPDDEMPPIGVNGDYATGALPEGIELSEEDAKAYLKSEEARILIEWEEDYGKNGGILRCNPISQWNEIDIGVVDEESVTKDTEINVSLMGNQNRRLYPDKYVQLWGGDDVVKNALEEESRASLVHLTRKTQ